MKNDRQNALYQFESYVRDNISTIKEQTIYLDSRKTIKTL